MSEHYKNIVKLVDPKEGFNLQGDDLSEIWRHLDDLTFPESDYDILMDDIVFIQNALNCEYGMDYQTDLKWDDVVLKMVDKFKDYTPDRIGELVEFLKNENTGI